MVPGSAAWNETAMPTDSNVFRPYLALVAHVEDRPSPTGRSYPTERTPTWLHTAPFPEQWPNYSTGLQRSARGPKSPFQLHLCLNRGLSLSTRLS